MKKKVMILFALLCVLSLCPIALDSIQETQGIANWPRYRYTYLFQLEMKGNIAFLIPYRFYHEASAAVYFRGRPLDEGHMEFFYDGADTPGYVMSTGGMTGNSLWFFTADYDGRRAEAFREEKIAHFKQTHPYYGEKIRLIRRKPMTILSTNPEAFSFRRSNQGVHSEIHTAMRLTDPQTKTYSNIYEIMGKTLVFYNHPFLPEQGWSAVESPNPQPWQGPFLDLSAPLTETVRLTSEYAEENADFRQKLKFRLRYRVMAMTHEYIELRGVSEPDINLWKGMKLRLVMRKIRVRRSDRMLIHDEITVDFREKEAKGGVVRMSLEAIL